MNFDVRRIRFLWANEGLSLLNKAGMRPGTLSMHAPNAKSEAARLQHYLYFGTTHHRSTATRMVFCARSEMT